MTNHETNVTTSEQMQARSLSRMNLIFRHFQSLSGLRIRYFVLELKFYDEIISCVMSIGRTYDTVGVLRVGLTLNQWYHAIQYSLALCLLKKL